MEPFLLIGLGGFIGANVRYVVSGWVGQHLGPSFPWGTLAVNFTGSLLLAMFIAWAAGYTTLDPRVRLFLATGFFGAYTTFSTYANESVALLQGGDWIGAVGNVLGTNLICLAGAILGLAIGSRM